MTQDRESATVGRFQWVDALRGAAALVIVVYHYHHFYLADAYDRPALPPVEAFPYGSVLAPLYGPFAANAVELFWLISGFVFAHVYLPRQTSAWAFGVARIARLYPLHLAMLLYVAAVQAVSLSAVGHWQIYWNNDVRHFLLQLLLSSNWTTLGRGLSFNGPIWSVSLEVVVYGMFFLSVFVMRRAPVVVALILCLAFWVWATTQFLRAPLIHPGVIDCASYFFLGCLLYTLRPHATGLRTALLSLLGAALAIAGIMAGSEQAATAGIAIALVSLVAGLDRLAPALGARLTVLGDISYSVYLVHVPLQMTILLVADLGFGGSRAFAESYLTLPVYMAVTLALAFAAYRWFERPAGKAIRRLLLRRP